MSYEWRFDLVLRGAGFLLSGLGVTALICAIAFVLAAILGGFVAAARLCGVRAIAAVAQAYVDMIRSTPLLIQLIWLFYALPILSGLPLSRGATSVLALTLYGGAYLGEVFRAGVNAVPEGQFEAACAVGLTRVQSWRRIIAPQALVRVIPPATSTLITMIKESALLSVIGTPELTFQMLSLNTTTFRSLEIFAVGSALYFALNYPIALAAEYVYRRKRVDFGLQRI
ncbi:MAG: amino acid ABC transporter permease [Methylobacteriaceae bacterium]|nr:amino acid ABC transporter permease [Methylobacteriaceae bacterium]